jgi:hypothetical protein
MSTILLNGKFAASSIIDPTKHKFIGNFRSPEAPCQDGTQSYGIYICNCGRRLEFREEVLKHWYEGHMDIPQYVDIKQ